VDGPNGNQGQFGSGQRVRVAPWAGQKGPVSPDAQYNPYGVRPQQHHEPNRVLQSLPAPAKIIFFFPASAPAPVADTATAPATTRRVRASCIVFTSVGLIREVGSKNDGSGVGGRGSGVHERDKPHTQLRPSRE
jgi:hypothetical protein